MKLAFPKWMAASTALAGLLAVASTASAVEKQAMAARAAIDVALAQGGLLRGQIVDAQGAPHPGASVSIWHENRQVAQTISGPNGQFSVAGLRGGVHQVVAGENQGLYRLWTAQAAPPTARQGEIVLGSAPVIRGQNGNLGGPFGGPPVARTFLTSPILWGGVGYVAGHVIGFNSGIDHAPSSP